MTALAAALMRRIWDRTPAPAPQPPNGPYASGGPIPAHEAACDADTPPAALWPHRTVAPGRVARRVWHRRMDKDLALLAELTTEHGSWDAAINMDWSSK